MRDLELIRGSPAVSGGLRRSPGISPDQVSESAAQTLPSTRAGARMTAVTQTPSNTHKYTLVIKIAYSRRGAHGQERELGHKDNLWQKCQYENECAK